MTKQLLVVLFLACLVNYSQALRCGDWDCYGSGVYCCNNSCCFSVWVNWWFWMIWIIIFLLVVSCGYAARRRRMAAAAQPEYIIVRNPSRQTVYAAPPSYGAAGGVEAPTKYYTYPGTTPTGNVEKPPPYSPEMVSAGAYANQGYQTQNETNPSALTAQNQNQNQPC